MGLDDRIGRCRFDHHHSLHRVFTLGSTWRRLTVCRSAGSSEFHHRAIAETTKYVAEQPELEASKDFRPPPVAARRHRDNRMTRIEARPAATLPRLATGAELADKPSWSYNWGIRATMIAAYTAALATDAMGAVVLTE